MKRLIILSFVLLTGVSTHAEIIIIPTPLPLTPPTVPTDIKSKVKKLMSNLYLADKGGTMRLYNVIWKNPKLSPQEFLTLMGTDCKRFHILFSGHRTLLNAHFSATIPEDLKTVTRNSDGTCTVAP